MSINNFTDPVGFSIAGLQNLFVDTINGNPILSTIIIGGQTIYLSYDSNTSTLTLLIPNSNGSTSGLLTAFDWNRFDSKENQLFFNSPLTRVGNYISLDLSVANTWIGQQTFNNAIFNNSNVFMPSLSNNTTTNIVYIDTGTGLLTYGTPPTGTNLLPLNNYWTGSINTFQNALSVYNIANTTDVIKIFKNGGTDYLYYNNSGTIGISTISGYNWNIDDAGTFTINTIYTNNQEINETIQINNNNNAGNPFRVYRHKPTSNECLNYSNTGTLSIQNNAGNVLSALYPDGNIKTIHAFINGYANIGQYLNVDSYAQINSYLEVKNNNNNQDAMVIRRGPNAPNEFVYFNNSGNFGLWNGVSSPWQFESSGRGFLNRLLINQDIVMNDKPILLRNESDTNHVLEFNSSINGPSLEGYLGVRFCSRINGSVPLVQMTNNTPFIVYPYYATNSSSYMKYDGNGLNNLYFGNETWYLSSGGQAYFSGNIRITGSIGLRNEISHTAFFRTTAVNIWITDTHGDDGKSKVVIGNLGDAIGGDQPCVGGHNSPLNAWTDMWINPYSSTYFGNVIVNGVFSNPSDRRIKTDISYLDSGKSINFIKALKPCIFRRCDKIDDPYLKEDEEQPVRRLEHGFIAQDIEEVATTEAQKLIVNTQTYKGEERKTITLLSLIPEIVQANKELIAKVEVLETENKLLNERISKIEKIINAKKCIAFL